MLVLSRKSGESIRIGEQITIHVVRINGNRVRIGIEAPTDIHVLRSELPNCSDWDPASNSSAALSTEHRSASFSTPSPTSC